MLPGLRFLFAATVLSISVLIFGLGAAALLRAAHQEFAHAPIRKPLPEPVFAQPKPPVLALLRVEPAATEEVLEEAAAASPPADAPEQGEAEKVEAMQAGETAAEEAHRTETTASVDPQILEPVTTDVLAPSVAENPSTTPELAAANDAAPPAPPTPLALPQIGEPAVALATSGGLAPAIATPQSATPPSAKPAHAKPERKAVRKRAQAHRTKKQRRVARRQHRTAAVQRPAARLAPPIITGASQIRTDQAGPVASGGPSGNPHSAHEPSYSALPRTPSR